MYQPYYSRARRLGAISLTGSVYILPAHDKCVEAFQWLAQEVRQAEGEVLIIKLQKQQTDVARMDYFQCLQGTAVAAHLKRVRQ